MLKLSGQTACIQDNTICLVYNPENVHVDRLRDRHKHGEENKEGTISKTWVQQRCLDYKKQLIIIRRKLELLLFNQRIKAVQL